MSAKNKRHMTTLHNSDLRNVTITLTVPRIFRLRLWLGMQLIRIGVICAGFGLKVERE